MNEIGQILKDARIEKGYTLDDLQQTTKIQKRYLQAIEDGNTEILPGRFYARAFVKQYADIVGVDGEQLLEEHLNETSKQASEEFAETVNVVPTRSTQAKRSQGVSSLQENLPTILIILLVLAIFGVIYFAWRQADNADNSLINENNSEQVAPAVTQEENEDASEEPTTEEVEEEEEPEEELEEETEAEVEEQEITVANSTGPSTTYSISGDIPEEQTIVLEATGGSSWVSISVVGGTEEAAMLADGQTLEASFGAEVSQVNIIVGNAPVTVVRLNDTELEYAPEAAGFVRQDLQLQFNP